MILFCLAHDIVGFAGGFWVAVDVVGGVAVLFGTGWMD